MRAPQAAPPMALSSGEGATVPAPAEPVIPKDSLPRVPPGQGPILVWFKHDLRVSDHPGLLAAAATGRQVIPFFCLDPEAYADLALQPSGPRALVGALAALRSALRPLGSDLVVRVGPADVTTAAFCAQNGVDAVMTEREVEARWIESKSRLSAALQLQRPSTRIGSWGAPLYTPGAFHPNFRSWKKARGSPLAPLPPPASLPALPAGADGADLAGEIPTLEAAEKLLREALAAGIGDAAARRIIGSVADAEAAAVPAAPAPDARAPVAVRAAPFVTSLLEALAADGAAAATPHTAAGGAAEVAALRAYLASQQPSAALPPGLAFLREAVQKLESPANVGGSFLALLGRPLVRLGRLSVRQVYAEAQDYERRRWGSFRIPISPATATARAALDAAELADFHSQLATFDATAGSGTWKKPGAGWAAEPVASVSASYEESADGCVEAWGGAAGAAGGWPAGVPRRCAWRWRGALTDYCYAEPAAPRAGAPAVLLCHGFGAFGDQWRGNLAALAAEGFKVYAPTLPGFGRSEKAPIGYSQDAWCA
ncbi:hypothetical protein MNEG_10465 [Monoraphidium neglectum]|uniref:Photolyase/cryptochrome alpha/beta domain-containing protein n=1 Tax=Monoraphidium neglectum TaxID=145388 RepID=A0A0D2KPE8_9CHLO|nr:hypothetical protein MNEG_10465 [Monoraphidium neglectum]KIY97498.1 hypothetical protein MNEG_10465 [Monoraphidium neglectum]|eukprot:XP_013896518.1 hypothetical protein MNEG_10465 [Monoraphidium neglectum]